MLGSAEIMKHARKKKTVILAFNIPYIPMVKPTVEAIADEDSFAFLEVARPEWTKFEAKGLGPVMDEFQNWQKPDHVRLHMDHVPIIDEDHQRVDYMPIFREAIRLGYHSVMIDGSRLSLEENIKAVREVAELAHAGGIPCEAELGAVLGHEAGPMPPYEELFMSRKGFTDPAEAKRFVQETGCDWLSVAFGSIHGAITVADRDKKKVEAKLNVEHLDKLREATGGIPLVLHGGSGVQQSYVLEAIKRGIAKVNIGTETRQTYEKTLRVTNDVEKARAAVYDRTRDLIRNYYHTTGNRKVITG